MEQILDSNLEVKVLKYESIDEMKKHIKEMLEDKWKCERSGLTYLLPNTNANDMSIESNWEYTAEFSRLKENKNIKSPISYETKIYWFNVYKSMKE